MKSPVTICEEKQKYIRFWIVFYLSEIKLNLLFPIIKP